MEDVRATLSASSARAADHPLLIGALALPGALAGGALAPGVAARFLGGGFPQEAAIFVGAFAGAAVSLRLLRGMIAALARLPRPDDAAPSMMDSSSGPEGARLHLVCG